MTPPETQTYGLSAGQRLDPITGEVQPWYTPPCLDEIQNWAVEDKTILEWGGGYSSLWWAQRCLRIFTIETSLDWCHWITQRAQAKRIQNLTVAHRPVSTPVAEYTDIPTALAPDIVIIDGIARLECLEKSLTLARPLTIIFDNWQQYGAFVSPAAKRLMQPFAGIVYPELLSAPRQPYRRFPWQTAIWTVI
jgi:hypothetical protein